MRVPSVIRSTPVLVCLLALLLPIRADDPPLDGQPTAMTRYAGAIRLVLTFTGPDGSPYKTEDGVIFNRRGELMPETHDEYVRTEDALYGIGKPGSMYSRATGPIAGPTCEANCGGITLWKLCSEGIIATSVPVPLVNLPADNWKVILERFATKLDSLDDRKAGDVVYWPKNADRDQGQHVTYVEEALGNQVSALGTKDRAESLMWRRGALVQAKLDPLYSRYGDPITYRLKPGVSLTWRYWREDPLARGVSGKWSLEGNQDRTFTIEAAPNHETEYPIIIRDASSGMSARGAFAGGGVMYRTEWGEGPGDPMKYQAKLETGNVVWTNLIERDPETNRPLPYKPETWHAVGEGTIRYQGTWMYRYSVGEGKNEVRRATDGQQYNPGTGQMMPFRVLKNDAWFTVDLATGRLSGTMAFEYRYGSSDKPAHHSHEVDLSKTRVDPVAFRNERGLFHLTPVEGPPILFSKEATFQPAGWPSLGDTFAIYGLSRAQLEALRSGTATQMPEFFCILSATTTMPRSTIDPAAPEEVAATVKRGEPVIFCSEVLRGKPGGLEATVVDGKTRIKEVLTARRYLPTGSRVETNADSVLLLLMEAGEDGQKGPVFTRLMLRSGSRFDTGTFIATQSALEVFLRAGGARVIDGQMAAVRGIAIKMVTPTATIIRDGTDYIVEVDGNTGDTIVTVIEGRVRVIPKNPTLKPFVVSAGQRASMTIATQEPARPHKPTTQELEPFIEPAETPGGKPATTQPVVKPQKPPTRNGPNLLKPSGPIETINTIVHHQLTNADGIRADCFPALSASGSHIVYAEGGRPARTWIMGFDGSNPRQVMETTDCPTEVDVSDDGSVVMVHHISREIYAVAGGAPRKLAWTGDPEFVAAQISGDGSAVCFILGRPAPLNGSPQAMPAGVYRVGTGGGAPTLVAGQDSIRAALGLARDEGVAFERSLAISRDGSRVAFGAVAYSAVNPGPKIMTVSGSGGAVRLLAEGTKDSKGHVGQLAITSDGERVAYKIVNWGNTGVAAVAPFGGGPSVVLSTSDGPLRYPGDLADPIGFTGDGVWVLLGSTGVMVTTDGKRTMYAVPAASASQDTVLLTNRFLRGVTDASGRRFVYVCGDERNSRELKQRSQIATAEINPTSTRAAPSIQSVSVAPTTLVPEKVGLTVTARATPAQGLVLVAQAPILAGLIDADLSSDALFDDGQRSGDQKAGDGVFTTNRLFGQRSARPGPRAVRVGAEGREDSGRRHATVIEVGPVQVRNP